MFPTFDPETKVWSGPQQPPIYNPEASFGQILLTTLNRNPTKVIQIDGDTGRTMTCEEMRLRAIRGAQNLTSLGYKQGDMVAMACANSENVAPMVVALLTIGAPLNTLAPNYGLDDLVHMLGITQPKLVFCDVSNYETVKKAINLSVKQTPEIYVFESDSIDVKSADDLLKETGKELMFFPPFLGSSQTQVGLILCSSGTMGLPKGVSLSHAHLITAYGHGFVQSSWGLAFNFSALYWASGVYFLLHSLVNGDPRLITRKSFSADAFYDLLEKYPIRCFLTPPAYAHLLLRDPRAKTAKWSSIAVWSIGGSFVPEKIRCAIDNVLPNGKTCIGYGNSETAGATFDMWKQKPNSVGLLMPNFNAKIVDEDGNSLTNGKQGELLLKFNVSILGYYNNPEATAAAIDAEGWFHTGDNAYFDEEGFLFLTDRKKELLKYLGYQISPTDLEAIVSRIDGVEQVCVVGLPDEYQTTDLPAAVIVKTEGNELTEEDVLRIVHEQVADYKKLRGGVFFLSQFPLTSNGKVLRRELREIILNMVNSRT
ncbi:uncharacterized protein LOC131679252 [Topomyia yanbarensis]|uniref:uncharacterized protein LOC131679252 n=1 Tax=Topomyia yanbarensis TaxID=2498891 RepID=UPI00273B924F|nr:uncharacterized protein LOC131679252 [Topomyia yanbarensis]